MRNPTVRPESHGTYLRGICRKPLLSTTYVPKINLEASPDCWQKLHPIARELWQAMNRIKSLSEQGPKLNAEFLSIFLRHVHGDQFPQVSVSTARLLNAARWISEQQRRYVLFFRQVGQELREAKLTRADVEHLNRTGNELRDALNYAGSAVQRAAESRRDSDLSEVDSYREKVTSLMARLYGTYWPMSLPSEEQVSAAIKNSLHFVRFGESYPDAERKAQMGEPRAFERKQKTERAAYHLIHFGKRPPLRKLNVAHLFVFQLFMPLGLGRLNDQELGAFFDEVCGCKAHDGTALRKKRNSLGTHAGQALLANFHLLPTRPCSLLAAVPLAETASPAPFPAPAAKPN